MKFQDIDSSVFGNVKEKLLESFRDAEDFGHIAGYVP